jgi:biopolymer transport protein ExbB
MNLLKQTVFLLLISAFLVQPTIARAPVVATQQSVAQATAPKPTTAPPPLPQTEANRPAVPASGESSDWPDARGLHIPRDLSPWSMFLNADILVKAVIVSLGFASLLTWTILIAKSVLLSRAARHLRGALSRTAEARTMADAQLALGASKGVLQAFLVTAQREVRLSGESASDEGIKERAASRLVEIARAEARAMRQDMAVLATIGATSPFVGLFGTVWGIMNSFIGISKAQTTNLAVVAPGIAEALLATAVGLIAAIPAVIIYNYFSRATKGYLELVSRGSGVVGRLLSRDLDRVGHRLISRAAE